MSEPKQIENVHLKTLEAPKKDGVYNVVLVFEDKQSEDNFIKACGQSEEVPDVRGNAVVLLMPDGNSFYALAKEGEIDRYFIDGHQEYTIKSKTLDGEETLLYNIDLSSWQFRGRR